MPVLIVKFRLTRGGVDLKALPDADIEQLRAAFVGGQINRIVQGKRLGQTDAQADAARCPEITRER